MLKYFVLSENITPQNLWDATKAEVREKFIALNILEKTKVLNQ